MVALGDSTNLNTNLNMLARPGAYYLAYIAADEQSIEIELEGETGFQLEVIDTWNMKVVEQTAIKPGKFTYQTTFSYTELRFFRE